MYKAWAQAAYGEIRPVPNTSVLSLMKTGCEPLPTRSPEPDPRPSEA